MGQHIGDLSSALDDHLLPFIGECEHGCLLLPKFPRCDLNDCIYIVYRNMTQI